MSRRKSNPTPKHKQIRRERDPLPWKYCFLTVVCGLILLAGFFGAARQHFASIEYSIKNSKLKKQIEELESEKRSLINARETALAPSEIIKTAKKYGFTNKIQENFQYITASDNVKTDTEKESVRKIADDKTDKDSKTKTNKKNEKVEDKKSEKPVKESDTKDKKGEKKEVKSKTKR